LNSNEIATRCGSLLQVILDRDKPSARLTFLSTCPATGHLHPQASTKLYCLVTGVNNLAKVIVSQTGFPRLLEFFLKFPCPGKCWKMSLVLEI